MAAKRPESGLRVGRLLKAHGLKGAIKIEMYTDDPASRFRPGAEFALQVPDGVDDRTVAESLIKAILWIDDSDDTRPVEEDAWYDHQLIGLTVRRDGVSVGTVARVDHFPAQDLLIVDANGVDVMVPFVKAIVTSVDIAAGTIDVNPPIGLFEEPVDENSTDGE